MRGVLLVKACGMNGSLAEELIKVNDSLDKAAGSSETCMVLEISPQAVEKVFLDKAYQGRGAIKSLVKEIRRKTKGFYAISCIFEDLGQIH